MSESKTVMDETPGSIKKKIKVKTLRVGSSTRLKPGIISQVTDNNIKEALSNQKLPLAPKLDEDQYLKVPEKKK